MTPPPSPDLLSKILALSAQAEAGRNYESAYHLLVAGLHDAENRSDMVGVDRVAEVASEQERRLEALDPPHHLSSAAARLRGAPALYRTLQLHVDAVRARIRTTGR